jgi:hypothetical protein
MDSIRQCDVYWHMRRTMNHLHWPYVSLVGLDHEKQVSRFGACLCLDEELEYKYAWGTLSLEEMEPRRSVKSICLLFANGVMSDTFLDLVGLKRPEAIGALDRIPLCGMNKMLWAHWEIHWLPRNNSLGDNRNNLTSQNFSLSHCHWLYTRRTQEQEIQVQQLLPERTSNAFCNANEGTRLFGLKHHLKESSRVQSADGASAYYTVSDFNNERKKEREKGRDYNKY